MKFLSLAVAVLTASSHFAQAHDVRAEKRERSHHGDIRGSKVNTGAKAVKENRGKREHERVGGGHPPQKRVDDDEPSLIIGGSGAQAGEFPFYVSLGGCGGSLIAPGVVLSAAHCLARTGQLVFVGTLGNGYGGQAATVVESALHPNFNGATLENDLMLLKLNSPVTTGMANLNTQSSVPSAGQWLTVIGTGATSEENQAGSQSNHLLKVDIPYVTTPHCQQLGYGDFIKPYTMFCAGGVVGQASCSGDSGGPIVLKGTHHQVGVVSFGPGDNCANGIPAGYARIDTGMGWIRSVVCNQWGVSASFCSGGSPSTGSSCTNLSGWADSDGYGCNWYENNPQDCQTYANDPGLDGKTTVVQACCACK